MTGTLKSILALKLFKFQKIRFLLVGITLTVIDFAILNLTIFITHMPALAANIISVTLSMVVSYFLNRYFVFRSNRPASLKGLVFFMASTGAVILVAQSVVMALVLYVLSRYTYSFPIVGGVEGDFIEANVAKLIATVVSMVSNFVLYKYVIFRHPKP